MKDKLIMKIYKRTFILSLFIVGLSLLIFKDPKPIAWGYVFGVSISSLSLKLLEKTIDRSVQMNPSRAASYTVLHYFLRYFIYFVVLLTAMLADYLNFGSTAIGLLMVKFVIVVSSMFDKNFMG